MTAIYESKAWKRLATQAVREAGDALEKQHAAGIFDEGDPNHPKYNNGVNYATGKPLSLFGYDTDAFMDRQHRR